MRATLARRRQNKVVFDASVVAALLALGVGSYFLVAPDSAFISPAYAGAKEIAPIDLWGLCFLAKGLAAVAAMFRGWRWQSIVVTVGGPLYLFWAVVFMLSAITNHWIGTLGGLLCSYAAFSHLNLARALREVSRSIGRGPSEK